MAFVLEPGRRLQREVRGVAAQRLDDAIDHLDQLDVDPPADLEVTVHAVRKRCKETRGLARLVKPALGDEFKSFDRTVRAAANELSTLRDAHAVLATFDAMLADQPDDDLLRMVRDRHAAVSLGANRAASEAGRIEAARNRLAAAREASQHWKIPRRFDTIEAGVAATYAQGRSSLRRVAARPTDKRLHEWRKTVKYLWYQMQLLHDAAPSVIGPMADQLDRLSEDLGDDHDLTVMVELLGDHPDDYGTARDVEHVCSLARSRQGRLRASAIRSGATIYTESKHAFARRIAGYWHTTVAAGPEPSNERPEHEEPAHALVERERKFLIDTVPDDMNRSDAVELRQGYLAADDRRSVRVRDAGPAGCTLTVKAGSGAERTELEWPIERREFDAAWPHTEGGRVEKVRHRIPFGDHVVELDVFGGALDGLVLAEVEFTSAAAMTAFTPPSWFGREVTDDGRYTNAALARHGRPATST